MRPFISFQFHICPDDKTKPESKAPSGLINYYEFLALPLFDGQLKDLIDHTIFDCLACIKVEIAFSVVLNYFH